MRLMFVGDISLGEHYFSFGHGPRSLVEQGEFVFRDVHSYLEEADYVIGNLEGPLSDEGYDIDSFSRRVFRGSPKSVEQLKLANIKILNVANNHSLQHGPSAFHDSLNNLKKAGLEYVGMERQPPLVLKSNDCSVGVLAASDVPDNEYPAQSLYQKLDLSRLTADISLLKGSVDFVVVILHWGVEGTVEPNSTQRDIAQKLKAAGANIIVGHHPHVVYEVDISDNCVVAYSLGNFVFDLPWDDKLTRSGILEVEVEKQSGIKRVLFQPVTLDRRGRPSLSHFGSVSSLLSPGSNKVLSFSEDFRFQGIKKAIYFFLFLAMGDTKVKLRFILWKLKSRLKKKA